MKSFSAKSLLLGKRFVGVEHFSRKNVEMTAMAEIRKKKNELIITQHETVAFTDAISDTWDKSLPFYLAVATNQVIQKEVGSIDPSDERLLYKAFPNLERDTFYYEIWRLKSSSIIAISRTSYIDELVSNYSTQKINVAGVSLGITAISELQDFFKQGSFITNSFEVSLQRETVVTPNDSEEAIAYDVNGLKIENKYLLAFASALRLILQHSTTSGNISNYNFALNDHYLQKAFFSKGFKAILGFLLTILLINFFVFSHYFKKNQEISETLLISQSSANNVDLLKERVKQKEDRVKSSEAMGASRSSLILNAIAKQIPQSILLSEMTYNPTSKKVKADEAIALSENIIIVKGKTISNNEFTNWIETLEQLPYINQVVISEFGKNDLNETVFTIRINLKPNETEQKK